jgi:hypothetical protein
MLSNTLFKYGYNYSKKSKKISEFHSNVFSDKKCSIYSIKKINFINFLKLKINIFFNK